VVVVLGEGGVVEVELESGMVLEAVTGFVTGTKGADVRTVAPIVVLVVVLSPEA